MKCLSTGLLILMFGFINLSAQSEYCGTVQDQQMFERLEENLKRSNETVNKGFVERFVPVNYHIVTDNDGSNSMSEDKVISGLCILNDRYSETDMIFYIDAITYINSTNLNHRPRLSNSISTMHENRNPNALNLYLVSEILQNDGSPSGAAGYYSGGNNDFVVMLKTTLGNPEFTTEHELGHFFSLPHTHVGWEGDISQGSSSGGYHPEIHGDTVTIEIITGSTQAPPTEVELMDGSNCTTAGDRICDTPPDYGFGQSCGCCEMIYDVWDRNGDKIEPMIDNVMSYSFDCDPFLFTQEQVIAMQSDYDSPFRNYLRTGEVTEYTPITSSVNVTAPMDAQTYDTYDGVLIEWEPILEAEYYQINISGTQQLRYQTTDTEEYITELLPNSAYFIDVLAVNKFGTGCVPITRRLFFTGSGSTSVNETNSVASISAYPNPLRSGEDLIINMESTKTMDLNVKLIAINGELLMNKVQNIGSGSNNIILNTQNLQTGLYLLKIETEEGLIVEKIIVE